MNVAGLVLEPLIPMVKLSPSSAVLSVHRDAEVEIAAKDLEKVCGCACVPAGVCLDFPQSGSMLLCYKGNLQ